MKIAITSTDGITVNQHFGKAESLYIYEMVNGKLNFLEKRFMQSYCEQVSGEPRDSNHQFEADRFSMVFRQMNDCGVLYTQQIGEVPLAKLKEKGLDVQLCSCEIKSIGGCGCNCCN